MLVTNKRKAIPVNFIHFAKNSLHIIIVTMSGTIPVPAHKLELFKSRRPSSIHSGSPSSLGNSKAAGHYACSPEIYRALSKIQLRSPIPFRIYEDDDTKIEDDEDIVQRLLLAPNPVAGESAGPGRNPPAYEEAQAAGLAPPPAEPVFVPSSLPPSDKRCLGSCLVQSSPDPLLLLSTQEGMEYEAAESISYTIEYDGIWVAKISSLSDEGSHSKFARLTLKMLFKQLQRLEKNFLYTTSDIPVWILEHPCVESYSKPWENECGGIIKIVLCPIECLL